MALLSFETPKKVKPADETGPYMPNMSNEDKSKYKAKHITGTDERIEIRKSISGTQIVCIVYKAPKFYGGSKYMEHDTIQLSANSRIQFNNQLWAELNQAIREAQEILSVSPGEFNKDTQVMLLETVEQNISDPVFFTTWEAAHIEMLSRLKKAAGLSADDIENAGDLDGMRIIDDETWFSDDRARCEAHGENYDWRIYRI